jgi:hypothetical protein
VFVDDGGDIDGAAVGGGVELAVNRPTLFGASDFVGFAVLAPKRLRRRRCGTRSPSSRQSHWMFLWFTFHPSPRAS